MKACIALLLCLLAPVALAEDRQGMTVSPISLAIAPDRAATSLTLTNNGSEDKIIQVELMRWRHEGGADAYTPSTDLLVNPPMFKVPAGGSQVVRLGPKPPVSAPAAKERTYRLYLQEVPEAAPSSGGPQLRLLLRLGVPVFIAPAQPAPELLAWTASRDPVGGVHLQLTNSGNVHVRVAELSVMQQGQPESLRVPGPEYVFAGETHVWTLKPRERWTGRTVTISVRTDQGASHVEIPLDGR